VSKHVSSSAIAGMRSAAEVDENVAAVTTQLDDEDFRAVDEILAGAVGTQGAAQYTVNEHAAQHGSESGAASDEPTTSG
jgi:diketogulonate reductase-like aldo/keto reductase